MSLTLQLPARLERVLTLAESFHPSAERARRALSLLLAAHPVAGPAAAPAEGSSHLHLPPATLPDPWCYSRLMPGGFPVEFAFSSADPALRYTAEVGGPNVAAGERLDLALHRLRQLGVEIEDADRQALQALQPDLQHEPWSSGTPSRHWGAWVGMRHRTEHDEGKVYVEVTTGGEAFARALLPAEIQAALGTCGKTEPRPVMVGLQPAPHAVEVYFRTHGLRPPYLDALLAPLTASGSVDAKRTGDARQALEATLEQLWGWPVFQRLPGRLHGCSYRLHNDGVSAFTLYVFAEDLFDSDARTRRAVLALGDALDDTLDGALDWDLRLYDACTAAWASSTPAAPVANHHGMFGISLSCPDSQAPPSIAMGLGLAPPE